MTDNLERIAPDTVTLVRDGAIHTLPVLRTIAHPPGTAPDAPIVDDMYALELVTARGSRWYGFKRAPWIGSDLRMHVILDNDRDEVRARWNRP